MGSGMVWLVIVAVVMSLVGAVRCFHAGVTVVMSFESGIVPAPDQRQAEDGEQRDDQAEPQSAP